MANNIGVFLIFLLSVTLLASPIYGRKGPGEYWIEVMKGQPMPEAIKVYVNQDPNKVSEKKETLNDTTIIITDDFDATPNASIYHDDVTPSEATEKADCNSQHNGLSSKKLVADNFEPRPNLSTYND